MHNLENTFATDPDPIVGSNLPKVVDLEQHRLEHIERMIDKVCAAALSQSQSGVKLSTSNLYDKVATVIPNDFCCFTKVSIELRGDHGYSELRVRGKLTSSRGLESIINRRYWIGHEVEVEL